ncbi:MAG: phosphate propanoyltransferase [Peptococcaceae bacterium]|nr:phosphate propanoyltransferase [Peptococcaceae bacterium]
MQSFKVPVGISNRHLHLSEKDLKTLFGSQAELTHKKALRQEGQFASEETVTLAGPKGSMEGVRVLGPTRAKTQVELTLSDAYKLGISPLPPVRESGDLAGSPGIEIVGPVGRITLDEGVIVAKRHVHVRSEDAVTKGVKNGDSVSVRVNSERGGLFLDVVIRVDPTFNLEFHIDTDESNAFSLQNGVMADVLPNWEMESGK